MSNQRSKKLDVAKRMPPLFHKLPGEEFDITKSEAARWLCTQPEIMQWVFDQMNHSENIIYDPDTGKWKGVDG